jgi:hypothetical protein
VKLWVASTVLGMVAACGGPSRQGASGEACFRVTDCELGLVCGPDQKCTSDLTAIDIRPDASSGGDVSAGGGGVAMPDASLGTGGQGSTAAGGASGSTGAGGASASGGSSPGTDSDAAE